MSEAKPRQPLDSETTVRLLLGQNLMSSMDGEASNRSIGKVAVLETESILVDGVPLEEIMAHEERTGSVERGEN